MPCRITEADDRAEISLAENVMREDMHPADQFEAFRALADKGMPVADIAARFGRTEKTVARTLAAGWRESQDVGQYRKGDISLEAVMAFCDHRRS